MKKPSDSSSNLSRRDFIHRTAAVTGATIATSASPRVFAGGSDKIRWNFEKFLLDGSGKVIKRFSPQTKPDAPEVIAAIEAALKK